MLVFLFRNVVEKLALAGSFTVYSEKDEVKFIPLTIKRSRLYTVQYNLPDTANTMLKLTHKAKKMRGTFANLFL